MTIKELHDLFYVEYDKANSITTYPNFTHTEIDKWLNKALLVLISQKFTGYNSRKVGFEGDSKRVTDLQNIVTITDLNKISKYSNIDNSCVYNLPTDYLFYIAGYLNIGNINFPTEFIEHEYIKLFTQTSYNKPWIKKPKVAIENNKIIVIYDSDVTYSNVSTLSLNYVKKPTVIKYVEGDTTTKFEFNDMIGNEVVSLAITYALENIESNKINTVEILNVE